jgi:hypothetical protein
VLSSLQTCDFDLQAMELAEKYADKIPRFAAYFSNQCLPNIKNYVWKPATEQFSTLNWTNNSQSWIPRRQCLLGISWSKVPEYSFLDHADFFSCLYTEASLSGVTFLTVLQQPVLTQHQELRVEASNRTIFNTELD